MDEVIGTQEGLGLRQGDGCPGTAAAPKFHRLRRRWLLLIATVGRFSIKISAIRSLDLRSCRNVGRIKRVALPRVASIFIISPLVSALFFEFRTPAPGVHFEKDF